MARAPKRTGRKSAKAAAAATADPRERLVDAFMALLAEHDPHKVELVDIAGRAGVTLAELRDLYPGKLAILADFSKRIDRQVLAGGVAAGPDEEARDRLFDVMMRRFDALAIGHFGVQLLGPFGDLALQRFSGLRQHLQGSLALGDIGDEDVEAVDRPFGVDAGNIADFRVAPAAVAVRP